MKLFFYLLPLVVFSSYLICLLLMKVPFLKIFDDKVNSRSLHKIPVRRIGGLAIFFTISVFSYLYEISYISIFGLPLSILFIVSLLDDAYNISAIPRLVIHLLAALIFINSLPINENFFISSFLIFSILAAINSFNFMDGANGLVGGASVIVFLLYAILSYYSADINLMFFNLIVAFSIFGFLFLNFDNAKIFLGDCGSILIGFLSISIGIIGWNKNFWPIWTPFILILPFLADTGVILLERIFKGQKFWLAHKNHYYQRLIIDGWSHRKTSLFYYFLFIINALYIFTSLVLLPDLFLLLSITLLILNSFVAFYLYKITPHFK
jgi:UDP-GlcNAc:undecaprenyl-phosphate/decaprenyl-phosphate GlcNAc-1-phosphate transferase